MRGCVAFVLACLALGAGVAAAQLAPGAGTAGLSSLPAGDATGAFVGGGLPAAPGAGSARVGLGGAAPAADPGAPITFHADEVEYDQARGVVSARGRVEAWQGDRVLRADRLTYDRNTGVATASGNVQLIEADGQVLFADEAELRDRFRDGVLHGVRALLAANGKLAANGARRTGGTVNELARAVYSSCDLCPEDPTRPPLWQIEARRATQDKGDLRIRYRDATLRMWGVPVAYAPYLSHPDPSAPRVSGFLAPSFGYTRFLGGFIETPYYWAIDQSSDLIVTPVFSTRQDPNIGFEYRNRLNFGEISANASIGTFNGTDTPEGNGVAGHIFARGRFSLDENWRAGFDAQRATSELYLRTFRFDYRRVLTSQVFVEGFWGTETYVRADARAYQGLRSSDDVRQLPYVLPNVFAEHAPRARVLGGQLTLDAGVLGILRETDTFTQRLATRLLWERPEVGALGDVWTFRVQGEARGYRARGQQEPPSNLPDANGNEAVGNLRAAIDWRLPLVRDAGRWGSQLIEPRVQVVTGPRMGRQTDTPNEDSIDFEFTDANLFALNRFVGRDRQEGGTRVDGALRSAWNFRNGGQVEALAGRSWRIVDDNFSPFQNSGLERRGSDWVGRLRVAPTAWFEVLGRVRTDGERVIERRLADATATVALGPVTVSAGYLYAPPVPYLTPVRGRDEVSTNIAARIGENWRVSAGVRYDLSLDRAVLVTASAGYEDECFIIDGRLVRRFAENPDTGNQYPANTLVLFRIGFKTLGDYSLRVI